MESNKIELNIEQAVDMLPVIGEIYDKLDIKSYVKNNNKGQSTEELGMDVVFSYCLKQSKNIKEELIEIAAIALGINKEVAKKCKFTKLIGVILAIKNDKELKDFFKQAL